MLKPLAAALLLAAAALAVAPNASAYEMPPQWPCGPTANCQPPTCTPQELVSEGLPFTLVVRLDGDCSVTVILADPECPPGTVPGSAPVHADGAVVSASAETCQLDLVCACDPILEPASAADLPSLDDLFQPCPGMGGCCGIEPAEGGCCSPTCPVTLCPALSFWTTPVLAPQAFVAVRTDCTVDAGVRGVPCPSFAQDRQPVVVTAGPAQASTEICLPYLVCTCPPLQAASAADLEPPVWVEFVVCVDGPCPPHVYCNVRSGAVPGFSYQVTRSCQVTVTQDAPPCQYVAYEETKAGPVTVRRPYCAGGPDPS